jgi:hypothetical protein
MRRSSCCARLYWCALLVVLWWLCSESGSAKSSACAPCAERLAAAAGARAVWPHDESDHRAHTLLVTSLLSAGADGLVLHCCCCCCAAALGACPPIADRSVSSLVRAQVLRGSMRVWLCMWAAALIACPLQSLRDQRAWHPQIAVMCVVTSFCRLYIKVWEKQEARSNHFQQHQLVLSVVDDLRARRGEVACRRDTAAALGAVQNAS